MSRPVASILLPLVAALALALCHAACSGSDAEGRPARLLSPAGLSLSVSFEASPDEEQLALWRELVEEASRELWRVSEGYVHVARCRWVGGSTRGEIVVRAEEAGSGLEPARFELRRPGGDDWQVEVRGRVEAPQAARELARALAQGALGLAAHGPCRGGCLLGPEGEGLCVDPRDHAPPREACASRLAQLHHGLIELGAGEPPVAAPATRFERAPGSS